MHEVFISHSSKDKAAADAVCHVLEQNRIRCWIAPRDVRGGKAYGAEIIEAIESCAVMVLLFSNNSNASEDVKNELQNAFSNHLTIIPYKIGDAKPDKEMQYFLSRKHWIDAYPDDTALDRLVSAVKKSLAPDEAHERHEMPPIDIKAGMRTLQFGEYIWQVLDIQHDKALIITKDIIEARPYSKTYTNEWKACFLREYLNGEFLMNFSKTEQQRIAETSTFTPSNLWYGKRDGISTFDKVFLLSLEDSDKMFGGNGDYVNKKRKDRVVEKQDIDDLDYLPNKKGQCFSNSDDSNRQAKFRDRTCGWWLRSPGSGGTCAAYVEFDGAVNVSGIFDSFINGVRPALWLYL